MMSEGNQSAEIILPELLTSGEAARLCHVGERTLWRWSRSGVAPAPVKIGSGKRGAVRFRRSEYLDWIRAGCPRVDGGAGQ
jgi:predicted DNA-binding transcriptional regulator AlpA